MNLKVLDCSSNAISSISALTGMPALSELKFGKSEVNDISVLEKMTNLEALSFDGYPVDDTSVSP